MIQAEGLTRRFGTLTAVDGLTLRVFSGEVFALVGPDGAGKTTTMRMLSGIMDPNEGNAEVLGLSTVSQAEALKEHIGYMPQRFGLYGDLTVAENIAVYADIYRVPKAQRGPRVPELLAFSNLAAFQSRLAANLSGGMKQKLGLVCALIHTPRLLFLDEPTSGVDPVSRREFWHILYRLLSEGLTIFLTTTYLDEAERAHRVGLIDKGRLLMADTPRALKATYKGDLLEVRASDLRAARKLMAGHLLVQQLLMVGDRLMVTVDDAEAARQPIKDVLDAGGPRNIRISRAAPSLEDLFVQIVRAGRADAA
ncbi:MAG: ABC transporter ATP-binding protein [Pseudomonadota bacterium]